VAEYLQDAQQELYRIKSEVEIKKVQKQKEESKISNIKQVMKKQIQHD
jgi:hypothetical protein